MRKGELNKIMKTGNRLKMIAYLHKAILDPIDDKDRMLNERTLTVILSTIKGVQTIVSESATDDTPDPFA